MEPGEIFTLIFWLSLASSLLATLSIWQKCKWLVFLSAVLSAPYALILSGYPLTRFFFLEPAFHLIAAVAVQGRLRWLSWAMLVLILGFAGWFLILRLAL